MFRTKNYLQFTQLRIKSVVIGRYIYNMWCLSKRVERDNHNNMFRVDKLYYLRYFCQVISTWRGNGLHRPQTLKILKTLMHLFTHKKNGNNVRCSRLHIYCIRRNPHTTAVTSILMVFFAFSICTHTNCTLHTVRTS